MPPRRPIRSSHRPGRGFRGRRGSTAYFDGGPEIVTETLLVAPSDLDLILVPPTDDPEFKKPQAGDLFPTVVTGDSAKAYLSEVDTAYSLLNIDIVKSAVSLDFKASWGIQFAGWKTFYTGAMASVGFFDAKSVMQQVDRYAVELSNWRKAFQSIGGAPIGPSPGSPGQGISDSISNDTFKLVAAVGAIAAIVVFGPTLARYFH